ncbi:MAG: hypothetical protein V3V85_03065 [Candidatus Thorarchaeota archaeon]
MKKIDWGKHLAVPPKMKHGRVYPEYWDWSKVRGGNPYLKPKKDER